MLYEGYVEGKAWADELMALRSRRTACDYVDMLASTTIVVVSSLPELSYDFFSFSLTFTFSS